jgi:hypothetical protein
MALTDADASVDETDIRSFRLVFEGVTCDDCGETVPVTRTCKCGAWEPRDDEHVTRRRAAIADIRDLLDPSQRHERVEERLRIAPADSSGQRDVIR